MSDIRLISKFLRSNGVLDKNLSLTPAQEASIEYITALVVNSEMDRFGDAFKTDGYAYMNLGMNERESADKIKELIDKNFLSVEQLLTTNSNQEHLDKKLCSLIVRGKIPFTKVMGLSEWQKSKFYNYHVYDLVLNNRLHWEDVIGLTKGQCSQLKQPNIKQQIVDGTLSLKEIPQPEDESINAITAWANSLPENSQNQVIKDCIARASTLVSPDGISERQLLALYWDTLHREDLSHRDNPTPIEEQFYHGIEKISSSSTFSKGLLDAINGIDSDILILDQGAHSTAPGLRLHFKKKPDLSTERMALEQGNIQYAHSILYFLHPSRLFDNEVLDILKDVPDEALATMLNKYLSFSQDLPSMMQWSQPYSDNKNESISAFGMSMLFLFTNKSENLAPLVSRIMKFSPNLKGGIFNHEEVQKNTKGAFHIAKRLFQLSAKISPNDRNAEKVHTLQEKLETSFIKYLDSKQTKQDRDLLNESWNEIKNSIEGLDQNSDAIRAELACLVASPNLELTDNEYKVLHALQKLRVKADELKARNEHDAWRAADSLHKKLATCFLNQLSFPDENFEKNWKTIILNGEERVELEKYRGWKNFISNLALHAALLVTTAGVGNFLAIATAQYQSGGKYFFFPIFQTDSSKQIQNIEEALSNIPKK